MNSKNFFVSLLLMISTAQCSAMYKGYYEKKHKVHNPYLTGSLALISAFSAKELFKSAYFKASFDRSAAFHRKGAATGCSLIAIVTAHKCCKDIYAIKHYHIKNDTE